MIDVCRVCCSFCSPLPPAGASACARVRLWLMCWAERVCSIHPTTLFPPPPNHNPSFYPSEQKRSRAHVSLHLLFCSATVLPSTPQHREYPKPFNLSTLCYTVRYSLFQLGGSSPLHLFFCTCTPTAVFLLCMHCCSANRSAAATLNGAFRRPSGRHNKATAVFR